MTHPEPAYSEIERLVKSFTGMPAAQRKWLNEMQTRLGFILLLFKGLGWDTSNISPQFPIRRIIDFGNPAEKSTHDEIVALVETMLALQKERQSVRREEDLDRVRALERQIAHTDDDIDKRVYELYGLTQEEIKIVEGA